MCVVPFYTQETIVANFAELKERIKIEAAIPKLGLVMRQTKPDEWRGICPRCKAGGERALSIKPSRGSYYCWADKSYGDVISLTAHIRNIPLREAGQFLEDLVHHPRNHSSTAPTETKGKEGARTLQPLDYLQGEHQAVQSLGIEAETAKEWGIGFAPKGTMRGRVLFPIRDRQGTLLAYTGLGENPRWLFPSNLDPATAIFGADKVGEGELRIASEVLDAVIAHQNGVQTVAFLTETVAPIQLEMLSSLLDETHAELVF